MIPVSVCIITKNEAEHLEKCLAALQPYPFEIVVVDTGSTDSSKEVARKYTDRIFDFEWINDFSAARNFSIKCASHNMILVLDTDEYITELDLEKTQQLIERNPKAIGCITRLDYFESNNEILRQFCTLQRLFNRNYYHYEGSIHEVLVRNESCPSVPDYQAPVTADHTGYLGSEEKRREKAMRNITLLEKEIEANPSNPYFYFQMGQSYLMMRKEKEAYPYLKLAIDHHPSGKDDYTSVLVCNYGYMTIDAGRPQEALPLLDFYKDLSDNADYLCMVGYMYLHLNQQLKALSEYVKALSAPKRDSMEPRIISYYIGYIYELFGKKDIARTHYQNSGDYTPSLEALERLNQSY